jgi:hypothetical protein
MTTAMAGGTTTSGEGGPGAHAAMASRTEAEFRRSPSDPLPPTSPVVAASWRHTCQSSFFPTFARHCTMATTVDPATPGDGAHRTEAELCHYLGPYPPSAIAICGGDLDLARS